MTLAKLLATALFVLCGCPKATPPVPPKKSVEIIDVAPTSIARTVRILGKVRAEKESHFFAEAAGVLAKVSFKDGAQVKAGQTIAELKSEDLNDTLALAKKNARLASLQAQRMKKLFQTGDISKKAYEEAEQAFLNAKTSEARAAQELRKTRFVALFSGTLSAFRFSPGASVKAGDEIVELYDPSSLFFELSVPEDLLSLMKVGQRVETQKGTTTLSYVSATIDRNTHMGSARASMTGVLLPIGATVDVEVEVERHENALVLPRGAVILRDGKPFAFVIANNVARLTGLTLGLRTLDKVEVTAGLNAKDQVVMHGGDRLTDGETVKVVP